MMGPWFMGEVVTLEKESRFDRNEFKRMLDGSALMLELFEPGGYDNLIFSIEGGSFDGGLFGCDHGIIFSIVPRMTGISIRDATRDEKIPLAPYIPHHARSRFEKVGDDASNYWITIDCDEEPCYIWSNGIFVITKEVIIREPEIYIDLIKEKYCNKPLWEGGPPLAEL